jgi:hypothetical protein
MRLCSEFCLLNSATVTNQRCLREKNTSKKERTKVRAKVAENHNQVKQRD